MTHLKYNRTGYDEETQTIHFETSPVDRPHGDRADPIIKTKIWEVDPQLQIINLLKEQIKLLQKLVDRDPPYHSGPQVVEVDKTGLQAALEGSEPPDPLS